MGVYLQGTQPTAGFNRLQEVDAAALENARMNLPDITKQLSKVGLSATAHLAEKLVADLNDDSRKKYVEWMLDRIDAIESMADHELKTQVFMYIPPERAKFWPTNTAPYPFGQLVADKFPSANADIHNASYCLAAELSTSATYHLMRALEVGLRVIGAVFCVPMNNANWQTAIDQIEKQVREMHCDPQWKARLDCKDQQRFYAQAISHFYVVKDAWRNYTMHAHGEVSQPIAELIYENVKVFLQDLAQRHSE